MNQLDGDEVTGDTAFMSDKRGRMNIDVCALYTDLSTSIHVVTELFYTEQLKLAFTQDDHPFHITPVHFFICLLLHLLFTIGRTGISYIE